MQNYLVSDFELNSRREKRKSQSKENEEKRTSFDYGLPSHKMEFYEFSLVIIIVNKCKLGCINDNNVYF